MRGGDRRWRWAAGIGGGGARLVHGWRGARLVRCDHPTSSIGDWRGQHRRGRSERVLLASDSPAGIGGGGARLVLGGGGARLVHGCRGARLVHCDRPTSSIGDWRGQQRRGRSERVFLASDGPAAATRGWRVLSGGRTDLPYRGCVIRASGIVLLNRFSIMPVSVHESARHRLTPHRFRRLPVTCARHRHRIRHRTRNRAE